MSSLLQNLIDRYPETFDLLFFFVRLGLFVYIAVGLFPTLRKHLLNWSNSNTNSPRALNASAVYNTQQAAQYLYSAQPAANVPQSANAPTVYNAPNAYNTQQAAHYTSQTQPNSLRLPSPERFVAMLIRLFRTDIINVRIGNYNLRIGRLSGILFLSFLLLLW